MANMPWCKKLYITIILLLSAVTMTGCKVLKLSPDPVIDEFVTNADAGPRRDEVDNRPSDTRIIDVDMKRLDIAKLDSSYRFSAEIPKSWEVEYVPELNAINIFNPFDRHESMRDNSQIFIRQFNANQFLTLSTVEILEQSNDQKQGHAAVRYRIIKKPGIADFPGQPFWRNLEHKLIDIRYSENNPSWFYVFSYHPDMLDDDFERFIDSLHFYNDVNSYHHPLITAAPHNVVKSFGIHITPATSPIQPERFNGFHTGVDFEISDKEKEDEVKVQAMCGGELRSARTAAGYGGVVVQECELGKDPITVIYGHLDIKTVPNNIGVYISPGDKVGFLGEGYSLETDGERKHLHLGVHHGNSINISGYVQNQEDLVDWMDPLTLLLQ